MSYGLSRREAFATLSLSVVVAFVPLSLKAVADSEEAIRARVVKVPLRQTLSLNGMSTPAIKAARDRAIEVLPDAERLWPTRQAQSSAISDLDSKAPWDEDSNPGFFINNPAILAGPCLVSKKDSVALSNTSELSLRCQGVSYVEVRRKIKTTYLLQKPDVTLTMNMLNASEAGFCHFAFSPEKCRGIRFLTRESDESFRSRYARVPRDSRQRPVNQLCQLGQSMPSIKVTSLPATVTLYLWRDPKEGPGPAIDNLETFATVIIELEPLASG